MIIFNKRIGKYCFGDIQLSLNEIKEISDWYEYEGIKEDINAFCQLSLDKNPTLSEIDEMATIAKKAMGADLAYNDVIEDVCISFYKF